MMIFRENSQRLTSFSCLLLAAFSAIAEDRINMEGLSIIGSKELPNVLYIVPWKSPELPDMTEPPLTSLINEALEPIDRESLLRRELYFDVIDTKISTKK